MAKYKKPEADELKNILSPEQYKITQLCGTEPPFNNAYWNHKEEGIYVDVVSGEPLFSSVHKYDSGTGWPSFTRPLEENNISYHQEQDRWARTEVRSVNADSHLGHVFPDGPQEEGGQRYCINSAALRFIPVHKLKEEGYEQYLSLFEKNKSKQSATAVFAAGCFWGVEEIFRKVPGVISTRVGYTGGHTRNPSYREVCTGETGHAEAIEIVFEPTKVSYEELVRVFFRMHDPTTLNRQHNDIGTQYRSAIFIADETQKEVALKVIRELSEANTFKKPVVTAIEPSAPFYSAEEEHQKYLIKNPHGYNCHILRDET